MPKILTRTKKVIILILLLTVLPQMFVDGFLAYLYHFSDPQTLQLLEQTHDVYYKICINTAYFSLILTYIAAHFIIKSQKLKLWHKVFIIPLIYIILFQILIFVTIFIF